jgi:hypothetical protein
MKFELVEFSSCVYLIAFVAGFTNGAKPTGHGKKKRRSVTSNAASVQFFFCTLNFMYGKI